MQGARPNELRSNAFPVVTARVSRSELSRWFPVQFEDITDPEATPEPSKGALARLANGLCFVVYWGEMSEQLTLRIPKSTDEADFLAALFREVPRLKSRILWRRPDAELPQPAATMGRSFVASHKVMSFVPGAPAAKTAPAQVAGSKRSSSRSNRPTGGRSSSNSKSSARKR